MYGPATVDAIEALQQAHGLPTTGSVDKATAAALQGDLVAKGGAAAQAAVASTAAVQQTLKVAGFWDGPVDGQWTTALTDALKAFQTALDRIDDALDLLARPDSLGFQPVSLFEELIPDLVAQALLVAFLVDPVDLGFDAVQS